MPFINLTKEQEITIRNGQKISVDELDIDIKKKNFLLNNSDDEYMLCKNKNKLICFFKIKNNFVKPSRVFNL